MAPQSNEPPAVWPEQSAIQVMVEADRVERRMSVVRSDVPDDPRRVASAEAVAHHLTVARSACRCTSRLHRRTGSDRWRGTSVEQAYRNLHSAKIFMVDLLSPADAAALAPEVCTRMAAALGAQPQGVCPSGDQQTPTRGDVLILAGLGAVGGGLSALLAIRNLRGTSTPYGVTMALAVLKVPSGALIALIGMLLLAGGFVPGLSNLDSQRQILAYALVFGYAQQLITRLADAQAQMIMNRLPTKDSEVVTPPVVPVAGGATAGAGPTQQAVPATPGNGGQRKTAAQSEPTAVGAAAPETAPPAGILRIPATGDREQPVGSLVNGHAATVAKPGERE